MVWQWWVLCLVLPQIMWPFWFQPGSFFTRCPLGLLCSWLAKDKARHCACPGVFLFTQRDFIQILTQHFPPCFILVRWSPMHLLIFIRVQRDTSCKNVLVSKDFDWIQFVSLCIWFRLRRKFGVSEYTGNDFYVFCCNFLVQLHAKLLLLIANSAIPNSVTNIPTSMNVS